MFQKILKTLGVDPHTREIQRLSTVVDEVNALEAEYEKLSNDALSAKTDEFRQRVAESVERGDKLADALNEVMSEAFAAVREASKRTIGLRHYDVQLIGGMTLHSGKIAEMRTGEGKTLVATLPLYLNAIANRGAHLVTVNDYLARRDARWMAPIYHALGLTVGVLQMAARTENGKNAFIIDLEKTSSHEDQHQLRVVLRKEAYAADITYGTNSEFGFDYLRDNLVMSLDDRVQRGHYFGIVDEVDNILIDEARTPLIISGPADDESAEYYRMAQVVKNLRPDDYEVNEKDHNISLTEMGEQHVEELLGEPLRDPERPEDIAPEQARLMGYLEQSLRAQFLYRRNKDYLVQGGKVVIVDEFTGRLMPGRRWSEGLHQAVEAKEAVKVEPENVTHATITIQNYFRMYEKLAGMTGTALTEAEEFYKIYKLDILPIPTNLEYSAARQNAELVELETKDEQGYKFTYYARRNDGQKKAVYWKRKDFPDVVYRTEEAKLRAITSEIVHYYVVGRPQLVGTTSVEHSERLSDRLAAEPLRRLAQVGVIRQTWLDNNKMDFLERAVPELAVLNKLLTDLDPGDLRPLAKTLGVSLNPEEPANLDKLLKVFDLSPEDKPRLVKILQGGIPHQVLNARKHDEESQIIAGAGAFGAVTIATNMAGRGVDIKLGGELRDDILADVIRVLAKAGVADPYDLTNEQRRQAILKVSTEDYGIYEESVKAFVQYMEDMERVRTLGGLHVIGSERHEARRIDNQLRGRAARQGDPGSSRFYLSLEDELMRLFGGGQAEGLFKRLNIDEHMPIESGLLGRLVEQSQERVEGANFDVRKKLLEYDDVLNQQRKRIYEQRDRVFTKEDLTDDVLEMLQTELKVRIPESLKDEEGPWKLLAYLEEIQPAMELGSTVVPSFAQRLLLDEVRNTLPEGIPATSAVRSALISLAERVLLAEKEHMLNGTRSLLERMQEDLEKAREERRDTLDAYGQGIGETEEGMPPRRGQEILNELNELMHQPLRLNPDQIRRLAIPDDDVIESVRQQVDAYLTAAAISRASGALKRRLEEPLDLRINDANSLSWMEISDRFLDAVSAIFEKRLERLTGSEGQIGRDLDSVLNRIEGKPIDDTLLLQLIRFISQGSRTAFDRKTHKQTKATFNRLNSVFLAARLIESPSPEQITGQILEHLDGIRQTLQRLWGELEFEQLLQRDTRLGQLDEALRLKIGERLGEEHLREVFDEPLSSLGAADRDLISEILGWRLKNETYRWILGSIILQEWIEYLTKIEALRVSISMEAYAQRDPLVMYKGKASDSFRDLLRDVRRGVIRNMFTAMPRRTMQAIAERPRSEAVIPESAPETPENTPALPVGAPAAGLVGQLANNGQSAANDIQKKKRKRH